jgi:SAM-dependent methyltransferase
MAWETKLYGRFIASGDRVLVVGCGGARDMVALLARGCRVEGLDVAEACLGPARRKLERYGYRAPLHAGDIATAVIPGRFDAVVFSWFCYSYLVGAAHRVSVLRRVGAQLADGGRILISYNVIPRPPRRLTAAIARMTALLSRSDWRPECGDTVTIVGHGMHRVLWHHCFVPLEIEAEARAAGLTVAFHESGREGVLVLTPVAGARGGRSR